MRNYTIVGLEGLCDEFGYCEPYTAGEEILSRKIKGEHLSEEKIEAIARKYGCRVEWWTSSEANNEKHLSERKCEMLKPGDPCPCCGQPIKTTDPAALLMLTRIRDYLEKLPTDRKKS